MIDTLFGNFLTLASAALVVYYYYVTRSGASKLLVIALFIVAIRNIMSYFISPVDINIVFYLYQLLQIVLSLLLVFAFYKLYKDLINDKGTTKRQEVKES